MPAEMPQAEMPAMPNTMSRGSNNGNTNANVEGFSSYLLEDAAGSKAAYQPMGAYDGVQLKNL